MSDGYDRCADELRALRNEVSSGFAMLREDITAMEKRIGEQQVKIALSERDIEVLQTATEHHEIDISAIKRAADRTPKGVPLVPKSEPHWIVQSAVTAAVSVVVASGVGYALVGWGQHIAAEHATAEAKK